MIATCGRSFANGFHITTKAAHIPAWDRGFRIRDQHRRRERIATASRKGRESDQHPSWVDFTMNMHSKGRPLSNGSYFLRTTGASMETVPRWRKKREFIYDSPPQKVATLITGPGWSKVPTKSDRDVDDLRFYADTFPIQVLLRRPSLPAGSQIAMGTPIPLDLVIDTAGKVRSVKPRGRPDEDLMRSAADWKFIPAFKNGRPVASRLHIEVSPAL